MYTIQRWTAVRGLSQFILRTNIVRATCCLPQKQIRSVITATAIILTSNKSGPTQAVRRVAKCENCWHDSDAVDYDSTNLEIGRIQSSSKQRCDVDRTVDREKWNGELHAKMIECCLYPWKCICRVVRAAYILPLCESSSHQSQLFNCKRSSVHGIGRPANMWIETNDNSSNNTKQPVEFYNTWFCFSIRSMVKRIKVYMDFMLPASSGVVARS